MKKKSLESDANKVEHAVCMKGSLIWNDYMKRVYVCIVFLQFKNKRRREEKNVSDPRIRGESCRWNDGEVTKTRSGKCESKRATKGTKKGKKEQRTRERENKIEKY